MKSGKEFIYILSNSEHPGIFKIGRTNLSPEERAKQLSRQTASIGEFKVEYSIEVPNSHIGEQLIHYSLKEYNYKKEFFKIDLITAIETFEDKLFHYFNIDDRSVNYHNINVSEIEDAIGGLKLLIELENIKEHAEFLKAINQLEMLRNKVNKKH